jgi:hypothetical protein
VVNFTPRLLHCQGKCPWYPLDRRLGGNQSQSERGSEKKNFQPLPGLEPPIIQLVAQLYTTKLSRLLYFFKTNFKVMSHLPLDPPKGLFPFRSSNQDFDCVFHLSHGDELQCTKQPVRPAQMTSTVVQFIAALFTDKLHTLYGKNKVVPLLNQAPRHEDICKCRCIDIAFLNPVLD